MEGKQVWIRALVLVTASLMQGLAMAAPGDFLKEFNLTAHSFVMDRARNIVYASVTDTNSVAIIDMNQLALLDTVFVGSQPRGLALSPDGTLLYVATAGASSIAVVNLLTRTLVRTEALPTSPNDLEVDARGRVFITGASSSFRPLMVYDPATDLVTEPLPGFCTSCYVAKVEMSPDGNTLFMANTGLSPGTLEKYDVSGAVPVLLWGNAHGALGSNGQDLWLSQTGEHIYYAVGSGNRVSGGYDIAQIETSTMNVTGSILTGAYPQEIVTSPDGNTGYVAHASGHLDVWDMESYLQITEYATVGQPTELFVDRTGEYLLAAFDSALRIYRAEGMAIVDDDLEFRGQFT